MKRRPKGTGSVTYLGNGRRKPYVATIRKKSIGTYKTKQEAEKALLENIMTSYNMIPTYINGHIKDDYISFIYDMQQNRLLPDAVDDFPPSMDLINEMFKNQLLAKGVMVAQSNESLIDAPTFGEIWNIEYNRLTIIRSNSWCNVRKTAFNNLEDLHEIPITLIKTKELQNCFDMHMQKGSGISKLSSMKNVCTTVFAYAIKMDYVDKDYSEYINMHSTAEKRVTRKVFTKHDIETLINDNTDASKIILIYIFTGMRPSELLQIPRNNIDIEKRFMQGGIKTQAGRNRIISIHSLILPYIEDIMNRYNTKYLFLDYSTRSAYDIYNEMFHETMIRLNLDHDEPYDTRHTFSTISKLCHVDTTARKKIMGHACNDITDDVYTHEPLSYLLEEIDKINLLDYC